MTAALVRWRADPKKIRVSIVRVGDYWVCQISERGVWPGVRWCTASTPTEAVEKALKAADELNFDGLDLDMQHAYEHPWKRGDTMKQPSKEALDAAQEWWADDTPGQHPIETLADAFDAFASRRAEQVRAGIVSWLRAYPQWQRAYPQWQRGVANFADAIERREDEQPAPTHKPHPDDETEVVAAFAEWEQTTPKPCERCGGAGYEKFGDDNYSSAMTCPTCAGTGKASL